MKTMNLVRRIAEGNRADKRKMDDLKDELKKLMRNRFKWAGHVERMRKKE